MRTLNIGSKKYTCTVVMDKPGAGGANHKYEIYRSIEKADTGVGVFPAPVPLGVVNFQNGPIKEAGVNGVMNEDLIAIVIDRMQGFQSGNYACRENAIALTKLEEALMWLRKRTQDREDRGVEGTSTI